MADIHTMNGGAAAGTLLLVEADDERALARGVQGFEISAARRLNRAVGRRGRVFADRYHAETIRTPRHARHALAYVLNNWRRHREDRGTSAWIDPCSTAIAFRGWKCCDATAGFRLPRGYDALRVAYPTAWLLTTGWRRHGAIDLRARPGPRAIAHAPPLHDVA
jgi:REP-associated tyrosine transposase